MKQGWLCYLWLLVFAVGVSAPAQDMATGHKQQNDQQNDACFKDPLSGPVWGNHLRALLSALRVNSPQSVDFDKFLSDSQLNGPFNDVQNGKSRLDVALATKINKAVQIVDESSVPMLIKNGAIVRPTPTPPSNQSAFGVYQPIQEGREEPRMVKLSQSVGRLQLKDEGPNGTEWVGIGTAFVVAPGVIATNCHVIADYVTGSTGNWQLSWKYAKNFAVDFSDSGTFSPERSFVVTGMYAPPEEIGLDVVFLSVEKKSSNGGALPIPVKLSSEKLTAPSQPTSLEMVALVGYPSPSDVFDTTAEIIYGAFGSLRYNKFIVPGGITTVQACKAPLDIVLNTISTTAGQSGSPLIDRNSGLVVGVHSCCADYFLRAPDAVLPLSRFSCASKRDTVSNQAVSSWSIWNETNLAKVLNDNGITATNLVLDGTH